MPRTEEKTTQQQRQSSDWSPLFVSTFRAQQAFFALLFFSPPTAMGESLHSASHLSKVHTWRRRRSHGVKAIWPRGTSCWCRGTAVFGVANPRSLSILKSLKDILYPDTYVLFLFFLHPVLDRLFSLSLFPCPACVSSFERRNASCLRQCLWNVDLVFLNTYANLGLVCRL
jgi:hypothetical protein